VRHHVEAVAQRLRADRDRLEQDLETRIEHAAARHSRELASAAPATSASSFAHWMLGCTRRTNGPWAKPQSVLATMFSRPTSRARRVPASATSSGCSTTLVSWLIMPGCSSRPSGSRTSSHARHSCSWRGFACSIEYPPTRTRRIRSTMSRSGTSPTWGAFQLPHPRID